ncbi:MAG: hypothetical protein JSV93_02125, partial [Candidatus Omnitrophota bacterium]
VESEEPEVIISEPIAEIDVPDTEIDEGIPPEEAKRQKEKPVNPSVVKLALRAFLFDQLGRLLPILLGVRRIVVTTAIVPDEQWAEILASQYPLGSGIGIVNVAHLVSKTGRSSNLYTELGRFGLVAAMIFMGHVEFSFLSWEKGKIARICLRVTGVLLAILAGALVSDAFSILSQRWPGWPGMDWFLLSKGFEIGAANLLDFAFIVGIFSGFFGELKILVKWIAKKMHKGIPPEEAKRQKRKFLNPSVVKLALGAFLSEQLGRLLPILLGVRRIVVATALPSVEQAEDIIASQYPLGSGIGIVNVVHLVSARGLSNFYLRFFLSLGAGIAAIYIGHAEFSRLNRTEEKTTRISLKVIGGVLTILGGVLLSNAFSNLSQRWPGWPGINWLLLRGIGAVNLLDLIQRVLKYSIVGILLIVNWRELKILAKWIAQKIKARRIKKDDNTYPGGTMRNDEVIERMLHGETGILLRNLKSLPPSLRQWHFDGVVEEYERRIEEIDYEAELALAREIVEVSYRLKGEEGIRSPPLGIKERAARSWALAASDYYFASQFREAAECHERAAVLNEELGEKEEAARNWALAANDYYTTNQHQKAAERHERAAILDEQLGKKEDAAKSWALAASNYYATKQHQKTAECHERAAVLDEELGEKEEATRSWGLAAGNYYTINQPGKAAKCGEKAAILNEQLGKKEDAARDWALAAFNYRTTKQLQKAAECDERSAILNEQLDKKEEAARNRALAAFDYRTTKQFQKAAECSEKAAILDEELDKKEEAARNWALAAFNYYTIKQFQKAAECNKKTAILAEELGKKKKAAKSLSLAATNYHAISQPQKAAECNEKAAVLDEQLDQKESAAKNWALAGSNYYAANQPQKAAECHEKAAVLNEELGEKERAATSWALAAHNYRNINQPQKAAECRRKAREWTNSIEKHIYPGGTLRSDEVIKQMLQGETGILLRNLKSLPPLLRQWHFDGVVEEYERRIEEIGYKAGLALAREIVEVSDQLKGEEGIRSPPREIKQRAAKSWALAASAYHAANQPQKAAECNEKVAILNEQLGKKEEAARSWALAAGNYYATKQHQKAAECSEKVAILNEKLNKKEKAAISWNLAAGNYRITKQTNKVAECSERAAILAEDLDEKEEAAKKWALAAFNYHAANQCEKAAECNEKVAILDEKLGKKEKAARSWALAAGNYHAANQPRKTAGCSERAAILSEELGEKKRAARSWVLAADDYHDTNQFQKAAQCWERAAILHEQLGKKEAALKNWTLAASNYCITKQLQKVARCHEKAAILNDELGQKEEALINWILAAGDYHTTDQHQEAAECREKAAILDEQLGKKEEAAKNWALAAGSYHATDQVPKAAECSEKAAIINEKLDKKEALRNWTLAAFNYRTTSQHQKAAECSEKAAILSEELDEKEKAARNWTLAAYNYHLINQPQKAAEYGEKAAILNEQLGKKQEAGKSWALAASNYHAAKEIQKAAECSEKAAILDKELGKKEDAAKNWAFAIFNYYAVNQPQKAAECREKAKKWRSSIKKDTYPGGTLRSDEVIERMLQGETDVLLRDLKSLPPSLRQEHFDGVVEEYERRIDEGIDLKAQSVLAREIVEVSGQLKGEGGIKTPPDKIRRKAAKSWALAAGSYHAASQFHKAARYSEKAAILDEELDEKEKAAKSWALAASNYRIINKYQKAAECHEKAAVLDGELGEKEEAARNLALAAFNYRTAKQHRKAARCGEKSAILSEELDEKEKAARSWALAAGDYHVTNQLQKAAHCGEKAAILDEELDKKEDAAKSWALAASNYYNIKQYRKAAECHEKAAILNDELGEKRDAAKSWALAAFNYHTTKQLQKAAECREKAAILNEELGEKEKAVKGWALAASDYYTTNQLQKAAECHEKAAILNNELGEKGRAAKSWALAASNYHVTNQPQKAAECREKAAILDEQLGQKEKAAKNWDLAASNYDIANQPQKATECREKAKKWGSSIRNDIYSGGTLRSDEVIERMLQGETGILLRNLKSLPPSIRQWHFDGVVKEYERWIGKIGYETELVLAGEIVEVSDQLKGEEGIRTLPRKIKEKAAKNWALVASDYHIASQPQKAAECREKAAILGEELGKKEEAAKNWALAASSYHVASQPQKAAECGEKAAILNEQLGKKQETAKSWALAASDYHAIKRHQKAAECREKAAILDEELGQKEKAAGSWALAASNYHLAKQLQKAAECREKSAILDEELGQKEEAAKNWTLAAFDYHAINQFQKAAECREKAAILDEELGEKEKAAKSWSLAAADYYTIKQLQKAAECREKAAILNEQLGQKEEAVRNWALAAFNYNNIKQIQKAAECQEKAAILDEELGEKKKAAKNWALAASYYHGTSQPQKTAECREKAAIINKELGEKERAVRNWDLAASNYYAENQPQKAAKCREEAAILNEQLDEKKEAARSWALAASDYYAANQIQKAAWCRENAAILDEKLGQKEKAAKNWDLAASNYRAANQPQKAAECSKKAKECTDSMRKYIYPGGTLRSDEVIERMLRGETDILLRNLKSLPPSLRQGHFDGVVKEYESRIGKISSKAGFALAREIVEVSGQLKGKEGITTLPRRIKEKAARSWALVAADYHLANQPRKAAKCNEKIAILDCELGQKEKAARSWALAACDYYLAKQLRKAAECSEKAAILNKELGKKEETARNWALAACDYHLAKQPHKAAECNEKTAILNEELGKKQKTARSWALAASNYYAANQLRKAAECGERLAILNEELGQKEEAARNWSLAAFNYRIANQPRKAAESSEKAAILNKELGEKGRAAKNWALAALNYNTSNQLQKAAECSEKAAILDEQLGQKEEAAKGWALAASNYQTTNQPQKVAECSESLAILNEKLGKKEEAAKSWALAASNYHATNQPQKAAECREKTAILDEELGKKEEAARSWALAGSDYHAVNQPRKAAECGEKAAIINEVLGQKEEAAKSWALAASNYRAANQAQKAAQCREKLKQCTASIKNIYSGGTLRSDEVIARMLQGETGILLRNLKSLPPSLRQWHFDGVVEEYERRIEEIDYEAGLVLAMDIVEVSDQLKGEGIETPPRKKIKRQAAKGWILAATNYYTASQPQKAAECHEKAAILNEKLGKKEEAAKSWALAAGNYHNTNQPRKAAECREKAAVLDEKLGKKEEAARNWSLAAGNYYVANQPQKAAECGEKAAIVDEKLGKKRKAAKSWALTGSNYHITNQLEKAAECHEKAAILNGKLGEKKEELKSWILAAFDYYAINQHQKAAECSEKAAILNEMLGQKDPAARNWALAAANYRAANQYQKAAECRKKAKECNDSKKHIYPGGTLRSDEVIERMLQGETDVLLRDLKSLPPSQRQWHFDGVVEEYERRVETISRDTGLALARKIVEASEQLKGEGGIKTLPRIIKEAAVLLCQQDSEGYRELFELNDTQKRIALGIIAGRAIGEDEDLDAVDTSGFEQILAKLKITEAIYFPANSVIIISTALDGKFFTSFLIELKDDVFKEHLNISTGKLTRDKLKALSIANNHVPVIGQENSYFQLPEKFLGLLSDKIVAFNNNKPIRNFSDAKRVEISTFRITDEGTKVKFGDTLVLVKNDSRKGTLSLMPQAVIVQADDIAQQRPVYFGSKPFIVQLTKEGDLSLVSPVTQDTTELLKGWNDKFASVVFEKNKYVLNRRDNGDICFVPPSIKVRAKIRVNSKRMVSEVVMLGGISYAVKRTDKSYIFLPGYVIVGPITREKIEKLSQESSVIGHLVKDRDFLNSQTRFTGCHVISPLAALEGKYSFTVKAIMARKEPRGPTIVHEIIHATLHQLQISHSPRLQAVLAYLEKEYPQELDIIEENPRHEFENNGQDRIAAMSELLSLFIDAIAEEKNGFSYHGGRDNAELFTLKIATGDIDFLREQKFLPPASNIYLIKQDKPAVFYDDDIDEKSREDIEPIATDSRILKQSLLNIDSTLDEQDIQKISGVRVEIEEVSEYSAIDCYKLIIGFDSPGGPKTKTITLLLTRKNISRLADAESYWKEICAIQKSLGKKWFPELGLIINISKDKCVATCEYLSGETMYQRMLLEGKDNALQNMNEIKEAFKAVIGPWYHIGGKNEDRTGRIPTDISWPNFKLSADGIVNFFDIDGRFLTDMRSGEFFKRLLFLARRAYDYIPLKQRIEYEFSQSFTAKNGEIYTFKISGPIYERELYLKDSSGNLSSLPVAKFKIDDIGYVTLTHLSLEHVSFGLNPITLTGIGLDTFIMQALANAIPIGAEFKLYDVAHREALAVLVSLLPDWESEPRVCEAVQKGLRSIYERYDSRRQQNGEMQPGDALIWAEILKNAGLETRENEITGRALKYWTPNRDKLNLQIALRKAYTAGKIDNAFKQNMQYAPFIRMLAIAEGLSIYWLELSIEDNKICVTNKKVGDSSKIKLPIPYEVIFDATIEELGKEKAI